MWVMQKWDQAI